MKMRETASQCCSSLASSSMSFPAVHCSLLNIFYVVIWIIPYVSVCQGGAVDDLTMTFVNFVPTAKSAILHEESSTNSIKERSLETDYSVEDYWSVGNPVMPSFGNTTSRNVTIQLGQTAYLHCLVYNLGDKTVSWIRRKDFHVLTVGLDTYTGDDRFNTLHIEHANDWALQVKYAQVRDEGLYECQVSTDPKISYFVNLTVLVAKAVIEGSPDIYVKAGSSINLTCVITHSPVPPVFVFWYHDERMINYDSSRGEINVQKAAGDTAISRLHIKDVQPSDSGNYTCCPSNAEATSITLHVLNGEQPAAMQHDANPSHSSADRYQAYRSLIFILYFCLVLR